MKYNTMKADNWHLRRHFGLIFKAIYSVVNGLRSMEGFPLIRPPTYIHPKKSLNITANGNIGDGH